MKQAGMCAMVGHMLVSLVKNKCTIYLQLYSTLFKKDFPDSGLSVMRLICMLLLHTDCSKWMSTKSCAGLLLEVKPHNDRIGPLVVIGLLNDSLQSEIFQIPPTLRSQVNYLWLLLDFKTICFLDLSVSPLISTFLW